MSRRYVLYPGPVTCPTSGEPQYVSASTLARLFGVDMRECVVFDPDPRNRTANYADCIHLHPEYDEECATPRVVASRFGHVSDAPAEISSTVGRGLDV
jgi:hypothetical protein